jgi:hypothetical protein
MSSRTEKDERRKSLRPHPHRDQIIDVMRSYGKPISPVRLARITGTTIGATAYHVRTLNSAGVIQLVDQVQVRGTLEHHYELVPAVADEVPAQDPIHRLLSVCDALTVPGSGGGFPRETVIDDAAREEIGLLLRDLKPKVMAIATAATARAGKRHG